MPASCSHGGDRSELSSASGDSPCVPSMATALGKIPGTAAPKVLPGCLDTSCSGPHPIEFAAIKEAAKTADAVIMALGLCGRPKIYDVDDHSDKAASERSRQQSVNNDGTEGEGHDRTSISCVSDRQNTVLVDIRNITYVLTRKLTIVLWVGSRLPDGQLALIDAVISAVRPSTKVILVLFNGGGLAIEKLMIDNHIHAIVFFPTCSSQLQSNLLTHSYAIQVARGYMRG